MEQIVAELPAIHGEGLDRRLAALGTILEKHIRSEERELFEAMQRQLPPEVLDGLNDDVRRTRGAG